MDIKELQNWLKELSGQWCEHDPSVQQRIAAIVESEKPSEAGSDYYLGYIQGMLACTERIKGVMNAMDDDQRALYFSLMKYCAYQRLAGRV